MRHIIVPVLACMALVACSGGSSGPDNGIANTVDETPAPVENADNGLDTAVSDAKRLEIYVGKYPFDKVDGRSFYDEAAVKAAVAGAVADKPIAAMVIDPAAGPADMIFRQDGRIGAWACEQHNCGDHQWTVLIDPAKGDAQVCYHDAESMQDQSRWYDGHGASALRPGAQCPAGDAPTG
ncbi:hypothetical protein BH10PSE12_BH10PSE12_21230 [soil metagenome]